MFSSTSSTRQPPAGGPGSTAHLDGLLRELRLGERDSFLRYFKLYRSPVYDFARRLLGDEAEAVAATNHAIVAAFRRVILDEDVADLQVVTCSCALEACIARADALRELQAAGTVRLPRPQSRRGRVSDVSRRSEAALETLELRRRAALLLQDVEGLSLAQMAAVFAIGEEAAGALLFRAREDFRRAFSERSAGLRGATCRQAEQAAAGAVGLGLGDDAVRRLHRHAAYCRPCRAVTKTWGKAQVGLAVLLEAWPLPPALATPPVFGATTASDVLPAVTATTIAGRALRPFGRFLRSKAAAYALAAACVALAAGFAFQEGSVRNLYFAQSIGPAIRLVIDQPTAARQPAHAVRSASPRPSSATAETSSVDLVSSPSVQIVSDPAAGSAAGASSGGGSATGSREQRTATPKDEAPTAVAVAGARPPAPDTRTSSDWGKHGASKHGATKQGFGQAGSSRAARGQGHGAWASQGNHGSSGHSWGGRSSGQHSSSGHNWGGNSSGGHSWGGHGSGQHSSGQHSSSGHSWGGHGSGQHSSGGNGSGGHSWSGRSSGGHSSGGHSSGQHGSGGHSSGQHGSGGHGAAEHAKKGH